MLTAVIDWWVRACLYEAMVAYQTGRAFDPINGPVDIHLLRDWLMRYGWYVTTSAPEPCT